MRILANKLGFSLLNSLSHNAGLITNFEVSRVLEVQKARGKAGKRGTKDMVFVEKQV